MGVKKFLLLEFIKILDSALIKDGCDVTKTLPCGTVVIIKVRKKKKLALIKSD